MSLMSKNRGKMESSEAIDRGYLQLQSLVIILLLITIVSRSNITKVAQQDIYLWLFLTGKQRKLSFAIKYGSHIKNILLENFPTSVMGRTYPSSNPECLCNSAPGITPIT